MRLEKQAAAPRGIREPVLTAATPEWPQPWGPDASPRRRNPDPSGVLYRITVALMSVRVRAIALPLDNLVAELRQLPHEVFEDEPEQVLGYESACPVADPLGLLVLDPASHPRPDIASWLRWLRPPGYTLAVLHASDLDPDVLDRLLQSAGQAVARSAARDT